MTLRLIHGEQRGVHAPDGTSPKAQPGTKMPKGLLGSLFSLLLEALLSSGFLKGVHLLPTTKDSDTADLDSISVALEPEE